MAKRAMWVVVIAVAAGCGGGSGGGAAEPGAPDSESHGSGDVLIPEEKFDEINRVFESKASVVSRCYVNGIEAGEIDKNARGHVTVGVTVTTAGGASDVKILQSDLGSPAIESCIRDLVASWTFTESLPKPLETSHIYVMDRF